MTKALAIFQKLSETQAFNAEKITKMIEKVATKMPKERLMCFAYKQGLFETREQAKRGVMAGLVVNVINGERYDKQVRRLTMGRS